MSNPPESTQELVKQAKHLKDQMQAMEENQGSLRFKSKVGLVQITVDGEGYLQAVHIDPHEQLDTQALCDHIQQATNQAIKKAEQQRQQALLAIAAELPNA